MHTGKLIVAVGRKVVNLAVEPLVARVQPQRARYPAIPVQVFHDVGHGPHVEEADRFNHLLLPFLAYN
jgi:pimeloyl-ACP methyl ester carboxylesterase